MSTPHRKSVHDSIAGGHNHSPSPSNRASRKSMHEDILAASHAVEQEINVVKALKRLSIGNNLNYDPDFPNEFAEGLNYMDGGATAGDNTSGENTPSRLSIGSSKSIKRMSAGDRTSYTHSQALQSQSTINEEETTTTTSPPSTTKTSIPVFDPTTTDEFYDDDEEEAALDDEGVEKLMWVPATAHPKLAPENFRKHVQQTVNEISSKLQRSRSVKSSLSSETTGNDNNHQQQQTGRSRSGSNARDKARASRNPSLKELSQELQSLSQIAGLDSTDAVTLARTLSTSSLGFTQVEREAFTNLENSNAHTTSSSSSMSSVTSDNESLETTDSSNVGSTTSSSTTAGAADDDNEDLPIPILENCASSYW
ncbi:unnamed protein product [Ambrosiozyma monospora]|uniref:Unnamed protein product n=1 Tax=Ambrosiozyma monospora TaxID=43982 RepID=A0ACB5SYP3_AMBMO|nr:unnamed protein product [Ambrosiozyma monospora]